MTAWYALITEPRRERQAAVGLAERRFTFFLPMQTDWVGSPKVRHMEPLIPGYLFVLCQETDLAQLHGVDGICGVVRYMRDDGVLWPAPMPAGAILGLQMDERTGLFDKTRTIKPPKYRPKKGETVKIKAGPYFGFLAKVLASPSKDRRKLIVQGFDPPRHTTTDVSNLEAA